jgi:hypothetical protein
MLRLCSDSSRSYPGRSVPLCVSQEKRGAVKVAVMEQKSAKAIVGVGRRPLAIGRLETSPAQRVGKSYPAEGPNEE